MGKRRVPRVGRRMKMVVRAMMFSDDVVRGCIACVFVVDECDEEKLEKLRNLEVLSIHMI